ncbi:MAG TPA: PP2C family protein-serine/threonine phosphatase, partial [Candidatus Acidoferrum sp.]
TVEYTCAGHPPPLLKRASGSVQLMENGGAVLGRFPHWQYENSLVQLAPGDRLLLFTDGITEACKADGEQLGEERLMHLLEKLAAEAPPALNRRLLESVKSFGGSHLQDDVTLIAIAVDAASQAKKQERGSSRVAAL